MAAMGADPRRVEGLWYDDGNIVLDANDRIFRIHLSILSHHSPVFRDLFQIPQPTPASTIDNCPVVKLQDNSKGLENLLRAIYYRSFFNVGCIDMWSLHIATSIIELSHKYDIHPLFNEGIARLEEVVPRTFSAFDKVEQYYSPLDREQYATAILVINVARRIHPSPIDGMLPMAFYLCSQTTSFSLVHGLHFGSDVERLSSEDLETCIEGLKRLFQASSDVAVCFSPLHENLNGACLTKKSCFSALARVTEGARSSGLFGNSDPLAKPDGEIERLGKRANLCESCIRHLLLRSMEERQKVWRRLPRIFGIEGLFTDDDVYWGSNALP